MCELMCNIFKLFCVKRRWSLLVNVFLLIVAVGVIAVIGKYYFSYWQVAKANNSPNRGFELPEGHPDISGSRNLTFPAEGKYCLFCHQGIEPTRPLDSPMMAQILEKGAALGDPNGCVVCHGGTPSETADKDRAHSGVPHGSLLKAFTPVPGALQVNENTCGQCHQDHTYNVHRSLMNTDAGKMKAISWSFGHATDTKDHVYADHDTDDPDGPEPRFGTEQYKAYMKEMAETFPGQYPTRLKQIPQTAYGQLETLPEHAAFAYLRNCNACHLSSKGMQDRGHYRGMGCAACHSIYSNEGYYEGGDPSIDSIRAGHLFVHSMQGSRKSAAAVHGMRLSGVQVSTCAACHAAGRRIGHAYQGLMALGHSDDRGPFDENGRPQQKNAGYVFKYIQNDAHHRISQDGKMVTGLLCQDCHTTNAMHGNGNIGSTTLATIEIECADCHGTATHYPWELPLGYGDEFGKKLDIDLARGVADEPLEVTKEFGMVYPKEDGYILSSRGNPLGNVIRRGNQVIVHSEAGHDFEVPLLKQLAEDKAWKNPAQAEVAMVAVEKHMQNLECYACHSTWAPQYYGYRMIMDFSKKSIDWLASAEKYGADGTTADYHERPVMQKGAPGLGDYSHVRWENPPLGINGEGRVSPVTGVIQAVLTVIDENGKVVAFNRAAQTPEGHSAMELAPVHPHTNSREARNCSDCHGNPVAMGYGTDGGRYDAQPDVAKFADLVDAEGRTVSRHSKEQIAAIKNLHHDFMQILNQEGRQMQTVDSHWPTSMPLTPEQLDVLSRGGTCVACHQDIPKGSIPIRMLGKIAEVIDMDFLSEEAHGNLLRQNNVLIAWIKAGGLVVLIIFIPLLVWAIVKRKKIVEILKRLKK